MLARVWLAVFLCGLLVACNRSPDSTEVAPDLTTQPPALVSPRPSATSGATPQPSATTGPSGPLSLNVWLIADPALDPRSAAGALLADQLTAFDTNRPDLQLAVELKSATGLGGVLSYLRTGRQVAASVLPDLIVLPADQLALAASEGLIAPLNDMVERSAVTDMFPVAADLARSSQGSLVAYPFALSGLRHLAYSEKVFEAIVPSTWDDLYAVSNASLAFPGAGAGGVELVAQLYQAAGGEFGEPPNAALELEALTVALQQITRARTAGQIRQQVSGMTGPEDIWAAYRAGEANMLLTTFDEFMSQRFAGVGFGPAPGLSAPLTPYVRALSYAISSPDPERQQAAAALLRWLIEPPNLSDWSGAARLLPARRSAFELWPADDPYFAFVQSELERAAPYPLVLDGRLSAIISDALFDVLSFSKTARDAAEDAIAALQT
jgi:ABC-type glycerol-3-phosphate transport system substrate-binding protein